MKLKNFNLSALTSVIAFAISSKLSAQTSWDAGGGATTSINLNTNWNNDTLPLFNGTQAATFSSGSAATMNADGYFSTLTFNRDNASGFTVNGASILSVANSASGATPNLTIGDTTSNGVTTINSSFQINTSAGATRLLTVDNREAGTTGASLLLTGAIGATTPANTYGMRFNSAGSTSISGTISNVTSIQQGSVTSQAMSGTVTISGNQTLGSGASVGVSAFTSATQGVVASTAKFVMGSSTSDVQSWGSTTINQASTVEVKSTATLSGGVSLGTAGSLGSSGGTLDVSGSLSATTLAIGGAAYSGVLKVSGAATFSGTVTSGATAGSKIVGGGATVGTLTLASTSTTSAIGAAVALGGAGANENNLALVKGSTGTLTINSANNTYTGGTTLVDGGGSGSFGIALGANNALGNGPLAIGTAATGATNGARLRMAGFNQTVSALSSGATANARVIENFGTANSVLTVNQSSATTYDGALRDRSTGAAAATGSLGLTKSGAGTLTLSSVGSIYTGVTTLSGGILEVAQVGTAGLARTISTTAGSATVGVNDTTGLIVGNTFSAATLPAGFTITSIDSPTQITINTTANIATGSGISAIFGVNSSIGMATNVSSNLVFDGGTLRYTGGTASTNRNFNITDGKVARIDVSNSAAVLTVSGAAASSTGSFEKLGSGTLTLTGANSYTGATTVKSGTLIVNGSISTSSLTTVESGASLRGTGTVGSLTVLNGGSLNPGNSAGEITLNNGLNLEGLYDWELATLSTANPGSDFDVVKVIAGSVDITGAALGLNLGANAPSAIPFWQMDQTWSGILNNIGVGSLTGAFAAIDNSAWSTLGSFTTTNTGNDVNLVWSAVPEPGSTFMIGGLGVLALLRRRRD